MRYRALSDVRIVDLTHHIAGPYATKLLAGAGAEVIKVEPPWGEGGRRRPPHRAAQAAGASGSADRGGLFAFLNTDKYGVTLNLKHARGRELLRALLREADLLVENFAPGTLARLGLGPDALLKEFSRLSIVSISNFGQDGPERDRPLNDLGLHARGGWTYAVGERDREPLTPPGSIAQYVGGLYGAIGAMQALFARDLGGARGQHVDIALLEATAATMVYDHVTFQYTGILRRRAGKRFAIGPFFIATLKCRDGYAGLHNVTQKQFEALCGLMQRPELARDERFAKPLARMANNDALLEICEKFFAEHDRMWLYREGQRRAIVIVPIPTVAEVLEWEQTRAREYFETIDDPVLGPVRIPGAPMRLGSNPPTASRPAPVLGEHNEAILGGRLGLGQRDLKRLGEEGTI
jgi:crotonobetainyl-CoA:carnitine CoA-transferase CaiB-like acyl-CoA transferase